MEEFEFKSIWNLNCNHPASMDLWNDLINAFFFIQNPDLMVVIDNRY